MVEESLVLVVPEKPIVEVAVEVPQKGGRKKSGQQVYEKETDVHRKMRAAFLSMGRERSLAKVARMFGYSYITVQKVARSFNWQRDAQDRDSALDDAFVEEHRAEINRARKMLFFSILNDIKMEALKRKFTIGNDGLPRALEEKDMERIAKKLKGELKEKNMPVDSWREMNDLLNALRKVVYEWKPGEVGPGTKGVGGFMPSVRGDLNVQLIIEK